MSIDTKKLREIAVAAAPYDCEVNVSAWQTATEPPIVLELLDQLDAARTCIAHLANRLAENPDLAYHFDPLTRSTELLSKACDALWGAGQGDELKKRILASIAQRRRGR